MTEKMPKGRLSRAISTGRVAAKIGSRQVGYLVKRPFLSDSRRANSKKALDEENARILFQGLSLLRGTALKAAQLLSFERDLVPESFRRELEKSFNQVPPMNRALVRQIITASLGNPPETLFSEFDLLAFAGASLGQVHRARSKDGQDLAVKIQYPDMTATIDGDLSMVKALVRPLPEYELIRAALEEIREVLILETDYEKEAGNIAFFRSRLNLSGVQIPETIPELCSDRVLTMSHLKGPVLNQWLKTAPGQERRNRVAQTLNDIFVRGFYELNVIHADPNPGNFLVMEGDRIGLLDFGCVRSVTPEFVSLYRRLIGLGGSKNREDYRDLLFTLNFLSKDMPGQDLDRAVSLFMKMGAWLNQMFCRSCFDFGAHSDFLSQGLALGKELGELRRLIQGVPKEFIFLDRTRYGLIRLFEQMGAKIRLRNKWEFNDHL